MRFLLSPSRTPGALATAVAVVVTVILAVMLAVIPATLGPGAAGAVVVEADDSLSEVVAAAPPTGRDARDSRPAPRFSVVDHNVQRRSSAIGDALAKARSTRSSVILLQEVCAQQVSTLREQHPDWIIAWAPRGPQRACTEFSFLGGPRERTDGNVAIWTAAGSGRSETYTFRSQSSRSLGRMACVVVGRKTRYRACSTHLTAGLGDRASATRLRQSAQLAAISSRWIDDGYRVVVGGDFNAAPGTPTLRNLYAVGGTGRFREASGSRTRSQCRCTTPTRGRTKFDYIFFSENWVAEHARRRLELSRTRSDHLLLWGRTKMRR